VRLVFQQRVIDDIDFIGAKGNCFSSNIATPLLPLMSSNSSVRSFASLRPAPSSSLAMAASLPVSYLNKNHHAFIIGIVFLLNSNYLRPSKRLQISLTSTSFFSPDYLRHFLHSRR